MQNKFRIWDNKLHKFIFGYENLGGFSLFGEVVLTGCLSAINMDRLNDLTIETYTNENTLSGEEIYEGDILFSVPHWVNEITNHKMGFLGVVKFGRYGAPISHTGFHVDFGDIPMRKDIQFWAKTSSIVGNIHENPELLGL